jgi:pyruvate dehydrogenase E1 component
MLKAKVQAPDDLNPQETSEWMDALDEIVDQGGPDRASYLLERLMEHASDLGVQPPLRWNTPYINTIPPEDEVPYPGDRLLERRIKSLIRWNAMAMVHRQNKKDPGIGGHISTYSSLATLLEVGFNHFFHARYGDQPGDFIYFQGHSSPGVYARAFLEGRLSEEQVKNFRHELRGAPGLPSYPHPWLLPDFWRFPTVSMGIGPLNAIYQARFMRYLENRGIIAPTERKVWAFVGDGETDEPESMGSLTLASREKLDNLIFVVNCNLQRLDGPVRGNAKIINELEAAFRGAGWNVIKVDLGIRIGTKLLARDKTRHCCSSAWKNAVDGEYQSVQGERAALISVERVLSASIPSCCKLVEDMSDDDICIACSRGGHDPHQGLQRLQARRSKPSRPDRPWCWRTTVKGYGLGELGRGAQCRAPGEENGGDRSGTAPAFRSRFAIPKLTDERGPRAHGFLPSGRTIVAGDRNTCSSAGSMRWAATVPTRRGSADRNFESAAA